MTTDTTILQINALRKQYAAGPEVLKGIDISLGCGEFLTVIGPSGAGKSTLLRCINGLVEASSGSCKLKNSEVLGLHGAAIRRVRRRIGMIFQSYALVDRLTVMENVLSGRLGYTGFWQSWRRKFPQADINRAFELLERVGLDGFENRRADRLSGGQRQRVGIARALLQSPELLLVDEPTASLDPKTARQIMRLLRELAKESNLGVIANLHDVELARMFSDRIVGLRDGTVVFEGKPNQLENSVLSTIYGEESWSTDGEQDDEQS
ncbi:MAG: phosphonate ABC transporter ATP-binding protein [Opitutales bacterium]|nr:phosphonate ABC transporter ATP-binding protein [Opitutales bacterium]